MTSVAASLHARLTAHWRLKVAAATGLTLGFFLPYFVLQHAHLYTPWIVPAVALDRRVPFRPAWMAVYLSLWIYLSPTAWLTADRERLLHYVRGMAVLCGIGVACFLLLPTAIERPPLPGEEQRLYRLVVRYDGTANAVPSLHAAFAVFAGLATHRAVLNERLPFALVAFSWIWCLAILYSTLATKQHVVIDLVAGVCVGAAAWRLSRGHER